MKIFVFRCGPLRANVDAQNLAGAKAWLASVVRIHGLSGMHLADECGVSVELSLSPELVNDDRYWSC